MKASRHDGLAAVPEGRGDLVGTWRERGHEGDADEVDVGRADIFQLGFGHGAHFCLGAHLARVELQVALGSLLARFPDLRLGVPADQVAWKQGSSVWGLESLPVYCRT